MHCDCRTSFQFGSFNISLVASTSAAFKFAQDSRNLFLHLPLSDSLHVPRANLFKRVSRQETSCTKIVLPLQDNGCFIRLKERRTRRRGPEWRACTSDCSRGPQVTSLAQICLGTFIQNSNLPGEDLSFLLHIAHILPWV